MSLRLAPPARRSSVVAPYSAWPLLVVLATAATLFAWVRHADHQVASTKPYSATFRFDDSTPVADRTVYESGRLRVTDPVFLKVLDAVDVTVRVEINPGEVKLASTTLTTSVVVASEAGWRRTLSSSKPMDVTGNQVATVTRLDFAAARALASKVNEAAGISGNVSVAVVATLAAQASLAESADGAVTTSYSVSTFAFDVGDTVAKLRTAPATGGDPMFQGLTKGSASASQQTGGNDAGSGGTTTSSIAPGIQTATGTVPVMIPKPAKMALGPLDVDVRALRLLTTLLLLVFGSVAAYNQSVVRGARRRGEADYLSLRYQSQMFPVARVPQAVRERAVVVGNFDTLIAVSQDAEAPILSGQDDSESWYYVFDGPTLFAYRAEIPNRCRSGVVDIPSAPARPGVGADDSAVDTRSADPTVGA